MGQPVCDVNFSLVGLLLHMNGANNSQTFVDSSSNALAVTNFNNSIQSNTETPGFTPTTGDFTSAGYNQYVSVPLTTGGPIDLSTGDCTIEGWLYMPTSVNNGSGNVGGTTNYECEFSVNQGAGTYKLLCTFSGVTAQSAIGSVPNATWVAFAVTVAGTSVQIWINGVASGASATILTRAPMTDPAWIFGSHPGTPILCYLSDIRITKGLARYTASYTPSGPFTGTCTPNVPNVVGQTTAAGTAAMVAAGYQVAVLQQNSNVVPGDIIISHAPTSGGLFPLNGVVTLTVSAGPAPTAGVGGDVWGAGGGGIVADNTRNPIAVALSAAQQPTNAVYQGNQSVLAAEANATLPLTMQTPAYTVPTTPTTG